MEYTKRQVTLPLDEYENMKKELESLKKQVEEKTVTRYIWHPIWGAVVLVIMLCFAIAIQKLFQP